jgi:hypothetical protein
MRHADADFIHDTSPAALEVFYEILRAVATKTPRDLMIKAYGWDPDAHE